MLVQVCQAAKNIHGWVLLATSVLQPIVYFRPIPTSAFAQTSLKIAVADTDKAFKESIWGKKSIEELEKEAQGWQKQGEDLDNAISKLEEDLSKQQAFLSNKDDERKLLNEIESKRMEGRDLI